MTKAEEIINRRNYLYNLLVTKGEFNQEEIIEKFSCTLRTIQLDLKELRKSGLEVKKKKGGEKKGYFVLENNEMEKAVNIVAPAFHGITDDMLIIMLLQSQSGKLLELSYDELFNKIWEGRCLESANNGEKMYGDRYGWYKKSIERLKNAQCIKERIITRNGKKTRMYKLGVNAPRLVTSMSLDGDLVAYDITNSIEDFAMTDDELLKVVKRKLELSMNLDEEPYYDEVETGYMQNLKWSDEALAADLLKDKILKYPYMECALRIIYETNNKDSETVDFKVGMVIFSATTNKLYLMGETINNPDKPHIIVVSKIIKIEVLEHKNNIYNSKKYKKYFSTMFGPGYDMVEDVEIVFKRFGNIEYKLKSLVENRNKNGGKASLTINEEGDYVYRDKIADIADIKPYIRRFGRACEVKKPIELRKSMITSANMILERYEKEGFLV